MFWKNCPGRLREREGRGDPPVQFALCLPLLWSIWFQGARRTRSGHGMGRNALLLSGSPELKSPSSPPSPPPKTPSSPPAPPRTPSPGSRGTRPCRRETEIKEAIVGPEGLLGDKVRESSRNLARFPPWPLFIAPRPAPTPFRTHTWRQRKRRGR